MAATTTAFSMAASYAGVTSTKQWLLNRLLWMLGLTMAGLLTAVVRFEAATVNVHASLGLGSSPNSPGTTYSRDSAVATGGYARHPSAKDSFRWEPIQDRSVQCGSSGGGDDGVSGGLEVLDPFPDNFEAEHYRALHGQDYDHYVKEGRKKGLECTTGQRMKERFNTDILPKFQTYIQSLPGYAADPKLILEIGPFLSPMVIGGDNVRYFDVMDLNALKERAKTVGYPALNPVHIHYVHPHGDLGSIPDRNRFLLVASSNVLPNQIDFIQHLQDVGDLLVNGGYYALTLADKRYMFDHFLPETDIATVLDDHVSDHRHNGVHRLKSVLEHRALTGHNDISKHWSGQHGAPLTPAMIAHLQSALAEYQHSVADQAYVDVHNYHFSPHNLALLIDTLFNLDLTDLKVHRLYDTVKGAFEFGIVLQKCKAVTPPSSSLITEKQR